LHWLKQHDGEEQWLGKRYKSAPSDGPNAKKMKFEVIQKQLASQFPSKDLSAVTTSRLIRSIFPNTHSKAAGKSRQKHIFGLEEATEDQPPSSSGMTTNMDLRTELTKKREEKQQLLHRVQLLEKVEQLEQKKCLSPSELSSEMNSLLNPSNAVYHGPNTALLILSHSASMES